MTNLAKPDEALEQLDELLTAPMLSGAERLPLKHLTALQLQAHAHTRGTLTPADQQVLSLVISRWLHAMTHPDLDLHFIADSFEVPLSSFKEA